MPKYQLPQAKNAKVDINDEKHQEKIMEKQKRERRYIPQGPFKQKEFE